MPGRWSESRRGPVGRHRVHHDRRSEPLPAPGNVTRGPSLYETVLRQAIATQHGLTPSTRLALHACEGCGKPYLLTDVWQAHSEEGVIACPRCGTEVVSWEGARGYMVYWHREGELPERSAAVRSGWAGRSAR